MEYANLGGYPNYCTCNPKRLVMFKVMSGKRIYKSEVASIEFKKNSKWAEEVLKITLEIVPSRQSRRRLVSSLQKTFTDLYGEFLAYLRERLKEGDFRARFDKWLRDQRLEFTTTTSGRHQASLLYPRALRNSSVKEGSLRRADIL